MLAGFALAWISICLTLALFWGALLLFERSRNLLRSDDYEDLGQLIDSELTMHPECFDSEGNLIREPWVRIEFIEGDGE